MENPKVMSPATMETFRFMDLGGVGGRQNRGKGSREEVARTKKEISQEKQCL